MQKQDWKFMYINIVLTKWWVVDLALLQLSGNVKQKHKTSIPSVQGLASVRLHFYKHTHVDTLMPHALFELRQHQRDGKYVTKWTWIKYPEKKGHIQYTLTRIEHCHTCREWLSGSKPQPCSCTIAVHIELGVYTWNPLQMTIYWSAARGKYLLKIWRQRLVLIALMQVASSIFKCYRRA